MLNAGRIDVVCDKLAAILEKDLQLFWLLHEKKYGKTVEAKVKESIITERDCTGNAKSPNNIERECHEKWNLLKTRIEDLYGKKSCTEKFLMKLFHDNNASVCDIQLTSRSIRALNNPKSRLPSYDGLFCSMILNFCNKEIEYFEKELQRRKQRSS